MILYLKNINNRLTKKIIFEQQTKARDMVNLPVSIVTSNAFVFNE